MFDSHCHLHDRQVADPAAQLARARAAGVRGFLLAGVEPEGWTVQEELARVGVELPVIVMTGYGDVGTAVSMLKRGAFDFFEKPFSDAALFERVQQAMELDSARRRRHAQREAVTKRLAGLTAREREVFDQVVIGKPNKVVASEFGISEKTVEVHRARVMQKLGAASLAELVRIDLLAAQPTDSMQFVRQGA